MICVYSDAHEAHDPPHQFDVDRMGTYSDAPHRAASIRHALGEDAVFSVRSPSDYPLDTLLTVHDENYVRFFEGAWAAWSESGQTIPLIPYTYAHRGAASPSANIVGAAGYHCFDPQTPIVEGTYKAAWASARSSLTAADLVASGEHTVYALCRPPGHHASADVYGGYCFFNNAALAAKRLDSRVAILDIDYHHGNGTQDIFYARSGTLTVNIHGHPDRAYPFFSGRSNELGEGPGLGTNRNFPLPPDVSDDTYLETLNNALDVIDRFDPRYLIVSAGFDIYMGDPLGDFGISLDGLERIGKRIAATGFDTLVVQEGGYHVDDLGRCARAFLRPLAS